MDGENKSRDSENRLSERDTGLLYGLISLHQREPRLVRTLALAAVSRDSFRTTLAAARGDEAERDPRVEKEVWEEFCRATRESKPLRALLTGGDEPLAEEDAAKVSTFARIADISPGEREVLDTQDGPFLNVMAATLERRMTEADAGRLLAEDLGRFLTLYEGDEGLAEALNYLESRPYWHVVLASVEEKDDYTADIEDRELRVESRQVLEDIRVKSQSSTVKLDSTSRLSRMPRRLFRLAWEWREQLRDGMADATPRGQTGEATRESAQKSDEARGTMALNLLHGFGDNKDEVDWIVEGIRLRFAVARHLISEREFAKLDALEYKWREAARILTSGPAGVEGLISVESYILGRPPGALQGSDDVPNWKTAEERLLYEMCSGDGGLQELIRLRPHFREMDRRKLLERRLTFTFEPAAPVAQSAATTTPTTVATTPATDTKTTQPEPSPEPQLPLDITFTIKHKALQIEHGVTTPANLFTVSVQLMSGNRPLDSLSPIDMTVPNMVEELFGISPPFAVERGEPNPWYIDFTKTLSAPDYDSVFHLTSTGRVLYERFFAPLFSEWRAEVWKNELLPGRPLRVNLRTDDPLIAFLPWEWLVLPGQEKCLLLAPDNSLTRAPDSAQKSLPLRDDLYPLRVTTAFAPGYRPEEAERRLTELHSMFHDSAGVKLVPGLIKPTTAEELTRNVLDFRPHVLHFEAPAVASTDDKTVFAAGLSMSELSSLVKQVGIQLVTFGNNYEGGFAYNDLIDLIGGLVMEGLPAAVVPTRAVEDASAINFWRGFYRAWLNGRSVEEAVAGARMEISRLDWSAFALFGLPSVVGRLRLARAA